MHLAGVSVSRIRAVLERQVQQPTESLTSPFTVDRRSWVEIMYSVDLVEEEH